MVFIIYYLALVSRSKSVQVKPHRLKRPARGGRFKLLKYTPTILQNEIQLFSIDQRIAAQEDQEPAGNPACRLRTETGVHSSGANVRGAEKRMHLRSLAFARARREMILRRTERGNPKSGGERLLSQVRGTYAEIQYWRQQRKLTEKAVVVNPHHLHKSFQAQVLALS